MDLFCVPLKGLCDESGHLPDASPKVQRMIDLGDHTDIQFCCGHRTR